MRTINVKPNMSSKELAVLFINVVQTVSPVSGVGAVLTLVIFFAAVYYLFLVPYQLFNYSFIAFLLNFIFAHWIQLNILFNYAMSILVHPGKSKGVGNSTCRQCRTHRPERSHHCRQCEMCVLMMDHHCLWINNCVGYYNFGYFVRAIAYVLIGAVYGVMTLSPEAYAYCDGKSVIFRMVEYPNVVVVAFGICVAVTVGFSIMNGWYIYLISKGMTSVEYKISRAWNGATSPYNRGWIANYRHAYGVHGKSTWKILLRPSYYVPNDYWTKVEMDQIHVQHI